MLQSVTSLLPLVSLTCSAIQLEMEFISETLEFLRDGQFISNEAYLEAGSIQGGMNVISNLLDNNVEVQLERGSLFINIVKNEAIMTGPAEISFYGSIEI